MNEVKTVPAVQCDDRWEFPANNKPRKHVRLHTLCVCMCVCPRSALYAHVCSLSCLKSWHMTRGLWKRPFFSSSTAKRSREATAASNRQPRLYQFIPPHICRRETERGRRAAEWEMQIERERERKSGMIECRNKWHSKKHLMKWKGPSHPLSSITAACIKRGQKPRSILPFSLISQSVCQTMLAESDSEGIKHNAAASY